MQIFGRVMFPWILFPKVSDNGHATHPQSRCHNDCIKHINHSSWIGDFTRTDKIDKGENYSYQRYDYPEFLIILYFHAGNATFLSELDSVKKHRNKSLLVYRVFFVLCSIPSFHEQTLN